MRCLALIVPHARVVSARGLALDLPIPPSACTSAVSRERVLGKRDAHALIAALPLTANLRLPAHFAPYSGFARTSCTTFACRSASSIGPRCIMRRWPARSIRIVVGVPCI
jgi:hypothetical protein